MTASSILLYDGLEAFKLVNTLQIHCVNMNSANAKLSLGRPFVMEQEPRFMVIRTSWNSNHTSGLLWGQLSYCTKLNIFSCVCCCFNMSFLCINTEQLHYRRPKDKGFG